ncbi:MAG: YcxB family protein [Chitinophagaceae bacterium]|nr:YcxB family protein [Chitinophagaceae bacterium]
MTSSFFTYDKPKVIQALRYHFISRREIKLTIILVNLFAILSALMYFLKKISPVALMMASGLWFILMISFWFILPYLIYKRSSTFRTRYKVDFGNTEMAIETENGKRSWEWSAFSTYVESPHFFHLYFNPQTFFLVPKDAFDNTDEARNILKAKINK